MGWNRMGAGASLFFKNEGPLFFGFILLISILLNVLIESSVMIRIQKLQNHKCKFTSFFCNQVFSTHSKVNVAMVMV